MILNALAGKALPIYGDGQQIRDWLYVKDHCSAIRRVLEAGVVGETYNVGGWNEKPKLDVVHTICQILDERQPRSDGKAYAEQVTYVTDRPGHDKRYAIDASKLERELGWKPAETFETGIAKTVDWYLTHQDWVQNVSSGHYQDWIDQQYGAKKMAEVTPVLDKKLIDAVVGIILRHLNPSRIWLFGSRVMVKPRRPVIMILPLMMQMPVLKAWP